MQYLTVKKVKINVAVDPRIAAELRAAAEVYDGRLGMCVTAGMLMFLQADPQVQGEFLRLVFDAEIRDEVEAMLERIKSEQAAKAKARLRDGKKTDRGSAGPK